MSKVRITPGEKIEVASHRNFASGDISKQGNEESPLNQSNRKLEDAKENRTIPMSNGTDNMNRETMGMNEQELEALIYGGGDESDDSLDDEMRDDEDAKAPAVSDNLRQSYSQGFMRQVSDLKNARIKKNRLDQMDTIVRDASNGLSYTRMKKRVEMAHPRRLINGQYIEYPVCGTSTGWHHPNKKYRESGFKELGVGVSLYFKFLKYLVCIFLVAGIFSLPAIILFINASTGNFSTNPSLETALTTTTIGNMGTVTTSCYKMTNLVSTATFFCSYGRLTEVDEVGTEDTTSSYSNCQSDGIYLEVSDTCDYSTIGSTAQGEITALFDASCAGNRICTIDLSSVSWPGTCSTSTTAYIRAGCASEQVLGLDKDIIAYIVVAFDIIIVFFIWIALQIHGTYEELEEKEIEGVILDGSDFTVDVENIPEHFDIRVLKAMMWRHVETVLKDHKEYAVIDKNDPNAYKIAQCNFALNKYIIMFYYKKRLTYEKKDRILALKQVLLDKSSANPEKKKRAKERLDKKRAKVKAQYDENEEQIKKLRNKKGIKAVKVYITMQSMEGAQRIRKAFMARKLRRC